MSGLALTISRTTAIETDLSTNDKYVPSCGCASVDTTLTRVYASDSTTTLCVPQGPIFQENFRGSTSRVGHELT